jgi:sec-independent protein translocase protein TatB
MFENLNWWEFLALILLALLIFGDRLPKVLADGLRMLRNLRSMARNATSDLSRELGTDIQLEDLHPKAFIRKHLLSEEEEEALRKPLRGLYDDVRADIGQVQSDLKEVADATSLRSRPTGPTAAGSPAADVPATGTPAVNGRPSPVDTDVT